MLWAYLQVLDRLIPRGLAWEGPIHAHRRDTWPDIRAVAPAFNLVDDARQVLESDVSVVVIITPPDTHASYARAALEAGKHVVCEKPVGMSRAEAEPVFELAASRGLHLLAAPFVQLSPTFRELWTRVQAGEIGHVHTARGLYGNPGSTWSAWFHDGGVGPLAEAGRLQPEEPDGAGRTRDRGVRGRRRWPCRSARRAASASSTPTPTCRR